MSVKFKFWKMHGAGNDFILVDDRAARLPSRNRRWIERICAPHTGVGAEGLILLQSSQKASFFMRFFNPDGREADMCGNGIRCAARLAYYLKIAGKEMTVQTKVGILRAAIEKHGVRVAMPPCSDIRLNFPLQVAGQDIICSFVNTGVPHLVIKTDNLANIDLARSGPLLRWHKAFAPKGTNVDYMRITGSHALNIRTYERGVEAETLACGTGITACAIVAALNNKVKPPVKVKCRHGDILKVDFNITTGNKVKDITLLGPTEYVFEGTVNYL
jgi:diaminopimelate epimerase